MQVKTATIDGKDIAYTDETEFLVQVGKHSSAYKTRYSFVGDLAKAIFWYQGINIGYGYKKRLLMPSCTKNPVIVRHFS